MAKTDAITAFYKNLNRQKYKILPNSSLRAEIEASLPEYMARPEYKGWSEDEVFADVLSQMELKAAKYKAADSKYLASLGSIPNSSEYGGCSYEDILNMADSGVDIPEDLLEWARAMANEDSINYEVDDSASTDSGFLNEMQSDMNDDKTAASKANVQKYSVKADAQNELLEKKTDEIESQNQDLEYNQKTLEQEQNKSNNKIQEYNKELNSLEQKVNNGENLTSNEQMRYKVLAGKINDENNTIIAKSENVQAEVETLLDSMGDINSLLNINQQISEQLRLKNVTFVSQETKSNSGILPVINKHIFNSNNFYLSKTLAGDMFTNMTDITQDIQINSDIAKLNVMNANTTALEINKDITNIENNFTNTDTVTDINNITPEDTEEESTETNTENETIEPAEEDNTNITTPETENIMPEVQENNPETEQENEIEETPEAEDVMPEIQEDSTGTEPDIETPQDIIQEEELEDTPVLEAQSPKNPMSDNNEVDQNKPVAKILKAAQNSQTKNDKPANTKFNFAAKIAELSQKPTANNQNPISKTNSNNNQNDAISNNEANTNENTTNSNDTSQNNEENVNEKGSTAQTTSKNTLSRAAKAVQDKAANKSKSTKHTSKLKQNEKKINTTLKENKKLQTQAKELNNNTAKILNSIDEAAQDKDSGNITQNEAENIQSENNTELKQIDSQFAKMKTKLKKNDKDVAKLEKDSSKDSKEIIQTANNDEAVEAADKASTDQNAQRHVTLSEQILDIKEIFKKTKIAGQALMLSPWTHAIGVTMSDIGKRGENISKIANKFVQIAHLDLISTGTKISEVQAGLQNMEAQSSSAINGVEKAALQADEANNKAVKELPKAETTQTQTPAENTEDDTEQTNTPVINSQNASKKENKEPLEITSSPDITEEADISINDISLEIDDSEIAQDNTEQIQQLTTKATEDSRAEYLKNPLINDDRVSDSQEISTEIEAEAVNVIAQESAKESAQKSVKESVREVMQSTLSSVNKRAQSKDTDKDKKYKLFTQFEREKQDAMKKAVQKVNRARDAR